MIARNMMTEYDDTEYDDTEYEDPQPSSPPPQKFSGGTQKKNRGYPKNYRNFRFFWQKIEEKNLGVPKIFVENFQIFWQKFETKSGGSKNILVFFDKFGKKSGGNENKGIPFILCSLIEKQRNSL